MKNFLAENLPTILLSLALMAVVLLIVLRMVRNKKQGKSSCGCSCGNCPNAANCHPAPKEVSSEKRA